MSELWKPIPFANLYEASNFGNIRNKKTKKVKKFNIEKLKKTKTRVRATSIRKNDGSIKGFYLHRIIAQTFLPNPNNYPEVNHKDGNPYNNHLDNLEWCSREQNMKHLHQSKKIVCHTRPILVFNAETKELVKEYVGIKECYEDFDLDISSTRFYQLLSGDKYKGKKDRKKDRKMTSQYKGVSYSKTNNKFVAQYKIKKKNSITETL